jgi:hypothetical protein
MISINSISVARGTNSVIKDFSAEFKAGTIRQSSDQMVVARARCLQQLQVICR